MRRATNGASPRTTVTALPEGVTDLVGDEARRTRELEHKLRALFLSRRYEEVITPTFERQDALGVGLGEEARRRMYSLFDESGTPLALRPDVTTSVARLAASRLRARPRPLRLFYAQSVFRRERLYEGRPREFRQAGVELIGARGPAADLEALALADAALRAAGITRHELHLGHIGFARGCLRAAGIPAEREAEALALVDRKDVLALTALVTALGVPAKAARPLLALPTLLGDDALRRAKRIAPDAESRGAVAHLADLVRRARKASPALGDRLVVDLSEVRGMDYYTGIMFEGLVPGFGAPLLLGGRYDGLVAQFGGSDPAVGFALVVERVRALEDRARAARARKKGRAPELVVALPKGRLLAPALAALAKAGVDFGPAQAAERNLRLASKDGRAHALLVKPADVLTYVEHGMADCGVVGKDVLLETEADVVEPLDLGFGHCTIVVAGPRGAVAGDLDAHSDLRVATKYPAITQRHFQSKGRMAEVIELSGSVELGPSAGLSDWVVDLVETGETLQQNGLVVVEEIARISARLIVNRVSHKTKFARMDALVQALGAPGRSGRGPAR